MKKTTKRAILVAMTVFSGTVVYFIFIAPLLKSIESDLRETATTRVATERLASKTVDIELREDLKHFLENKENLFMDGEHPADAVLLLREIADSHGIEKEIRAIEPEETSQENWPYFGVDLSFSGTEEDLLHFFRDIETSGILVDVSEASIRKDSNDETQLQGNISLKIFHK